MTDSNSDTERALVRHMLATLAYRAAKTLRDAPDGFAQFSGGPTVRRPLQIVAHMGDLLSWACYLARGEKTWNDATPQSWDHEVERFFDAPPERGGWGATVVRLTRDERRTGE